MNADELIRKLKSIRAWTPETSVTARNKINELIQQLGGIP